MYGDHFSMYTIAMAQPLPAGLELSLKIGVPLFQGCYISLELPDSLHRVVHHLDLKLVDDAGGLSAVEEAVVLGLHIRLVNSRRSDVIITNGSGVMIHLLFLVNIFFMVRFWSNGIVSWIGIIDVLDIFGSWGSVSLILDLMVRFGLSHI